MKSFLLLFQLPSSISHCHLHVAIEVIYFIVRMLAEQGAREICQSKCVLDLFLVGVATAWSHLALLEISLSINIGRLNVAGALGVSGI